MDELDDFSGFNNNTSYLKAPQTSQLNINISDSNIHHHHHHHQHKVVPPHLWSNKQSPVTLPSKSLSNLIFDSLDGFFFVLNSNGIIKFTSENIVNYIKYSQVSS